MKWILAALLLVAVVGSAQAADDQAYLGIFAETTVMRMSGMPVMPAMPALPAGMPAIPGMGMFSGAPERKLNVRLWSPGVAPANATASIAPPDGLKLGKKLDLEIYKPETERGGPGMEQGGTGDQGGQTEFTIKIYWGSSKTVKEGQPKIIHFDKAAMDKPEYKEQMARVKAAQSRQGDLYRPGYTTAYWPTKKQPGKIDPNALLTGNYALTTNYTGNIAIDAPSDVVFLDPFDLTSPKLDKKLQLDQSVGMVWKPIPNALGLYATMMGFEGKSTMIIWSSSEVYSEALMGMIGGYMQMAEVKERVKSTVMMKGDQTKVDIPAGIFKNTDFSMLEMVGYGPGAALPSGQPLPRIQSKTSLRLIISKMAGGTPPEANDTTAPPTLEPADGDAPPPEPPPLPDPEPPPPPDPSVENPTFSGG